MTAVKTNREKQIKKIPFYERSIYRRDQNKMKQWKKQCEDWNKMITYSCEKVKRPVMSSIVVKQDGYRPKREIALALGILKEPAIKFRN